MLTFLTVLASGAAADTSDAAFVSFSGQYCPHNLFVENIDFEVTTLPSNAGACGAGCEKADRCTAFEVSKEEGCVFWYQNACETQGLVSIDQRVTYISSASLAADVTEVSTTTAAASTTTAATTTAAAVETTVEAVQVYQDLYALKYPQQACSWANYVEDIDWMMYNDGSNDAVSCAAACFENEDCTGFEVGSASGSEFSNGPYCAFWLNGACTTPTESYYNAYSSLTGEAIQVDTYTLTEPLDAFTEYESMACAWSSYVEGEDWEFASKDSDDAAACAKLCLDAAGQGCTGFEIGTSESMQLGDLSKGYCAFWYNNTCGSRHEMFSADEASTYVLVTASDCSGHFMSQFFYVALLVAGLMACLGVCCCCRAAIRRRRMQLRARLAARTRTAARAAPGTAPVAAVTIEGAPRGTRAVVYAVQIADDQQEEPQKV